MTFIVMIGVTFVVTSDIQIKFVSEVSFKMIPFSRVMILAKSGLFLLLEK